MAKFKCKICGSKIELKKYSIKVVAGSVVSPEAKCCMVHMERISTNGGFGGIIKKPNGTVGGKF